MTRRTPAFASSYKRPYGCEIRRNITPVVLAALKTKGGLVKGAGPDATLGLSARVAPGRCPGKRTAAAATSAGSYLAGTGARRGRGPAVRETPSEATGPGKLLPGAHLAPRRAAVVS